jgi:hypothetical protein
MSVETRSQSRSIASRRARTADETADRAREMCRNRPLSLAHRAAQMLPMTETRSRVQIVTSRGSAAGLSTPQALRSSARRTAAEQGGAVLPVRAAHASQSQATAGAASGQERKACDRVSMWPAAEHAGLRHRLGQGATMAATLLCTWWRKAWQPSCPCRRRHAVMTNGRCNARSRSRPQGRSFLTGGANSQGGPPRPARC